MESSADVRLWRDQVWDALEPIRGKGAHVLIDVSSIRLAPAIAGEYGAIANEVPGEFDVTIVRYGDTGAATLTVIELQSIIQGMPQRVLRDLAEAQRAVLAHHGA